MVITEVRIKLCDQNNERLLAFCSVTFDNAFVVRDLKLIEGTKGWFVAMPSRKLTDRCPSCGTKNHLRARFCNSCRYHLDQERATRNAEGRAKLHADIAHPINPWARELIQAAVVKAYHEEKERSKLPGYVCTYDDFDVPDLDDNLRCHPGTPNPIAPPHGPGLHQPPRQPTRPGDARRDS
ncbi:MAG: stage V sporulation protein G [Candidatus Melainabacteria bacterium]|nr:MAG: stage V sporulation protein G [Candidatus Melainabacteria bacterium]